MMGALFALFGFSHNGVRQTIIVCGVKLVHLAYDPFHLVLISGVDWDIGALITIE